MKRRARRNHSPAFKAKVALAALIGDKTLAQIAEEFDVHPNQITGWKQQLENRSAELFGKTSEPEISTVDIKTLHAKIGQLTLENDFLGGALTKAGLLSAKKMINRAHKLPISRQAELLGISRASVYYLPRPVSENDLTIMRRLDELHLRYPFMGARMLRDQLNRQGIDIGRKHVSTLMKKININAVYRKPNTSKKEPGHKIYPYLLRTLTINKPNQVWALDTSYIPMARGFVYLTAVIDWNSRKVLASKVAITLEACHAVDVLEEAFKLYGTPEIINTDQGSQFTATIFVDCVEAKGCRLSMDGRGAWRDNVFIERVWRSVKYECVYLYAYESVKEAKHSIKKYLDWYNQERPHSNLNRLTPDEAYYGLLSPLKAA